MSLKYYYAFTNFFGLGKGPTSATRDFDTKGSQYLDLTGNFDLGSGFGVVGARRLAEDQERATRSQGLVSRTRNISDYKLGVTYDIERLGLDRRLAVVGTSEKGFFRTAESDFTEDAGKTSSSSRSRRPSD